MIFAVVAPLILAAGVERRPLTCRSRERVVMARQRFLGDDIQADAFDARRRPGEIIVDDLAVEADGFKNLRAAIALDGRDAHLGHRFDDALDRGLDEFLHRLLVVDVLQQPLRGSCRRASRRRDTD